MELIPEWKDVWKMWSTWAAGALAVWNMMPAAVSNIIPGNYQLAISATLFAGFVIARIVNQPAVSKGSDSGGQ